MSVETDSNTKDDLASIYVPLLDEGTDVIRPTLAIRRTRSRYEILPTEDYDPEDEHWEFEPGSLVYCEVELHEGEELLVARLRA